MKGRGIWIWRLNKCENGKLVDILKKCKKANIEWIAVKCGNAGVPWEQFNAALVTTCHVFGIKIYGWSYDLPTKIDEQVKVIKSISEIGANGYIIDAETEWDKGVKNKAVEYMKKIRENVPSDFIIADAPWDVPTYHGGFPFKEFSVDVRSPQVYFIAHGISFEKTWERYKKTWKDISKHVPSCSTWSKPTRKVTVSDIKKFEESAKQSGCPGVCHWEWAAIPRDIWEWFENNKY